MLALSLVLSGCSTEAEQEKLTKQIASWCETVQMAGDHWARGDVPQAYAKDTFEKAASEIEDIRSKLDKQENRAVVRALFDERIGHIEHALSIGSTAIERRDGTTLAAALHEIAVQEAALKAMGRSARP